MYKVKELDQIEEDLPNINKSRTIELIIMSLINTCRKLYRLLNKRNKKNLFLITKEYHKRQDLTSCKFSITFQDHDGNVDSLVYDSPPFNLQDNKDFIRSVIFTGFSLWAQSQGYKLILEKDEQASGEKASV
jgi:hypothetical protein